MIYVGSFPPNCPAFNYFPAFINQVFPPKARQFLLTLWSDKLDFLRVDFSMNNARSDLRLSIGDFRANLRQNRTKTVITDSNFPNIGESFPRKGSTLHWLRPFYFRTRGCWMFALRSTVPREFAGAESIWGKFNRSFRIGTSDFITKNYVRFDFAAFFVSFGFNAITKSRRCSSPAIGNGKSFNSRSTRKLYWLCISSFCALIIVSSGIYTCWKINRVDWNRSVLNIELRSTCD